MITALFAATSAPVAAVRISRPVLASTIDRAHFAACLATGFRSPETDAHRIACEAAKKGRSPALDTPRGARYLSPALLSPPSLRAAVPVRASRAVVATVEPHRVGLAVLKMLAALDNGRLGRGVDAVFIAAARTLPVLTQTASARGVAAQERIYETIAAQPDRSRVPVLLAIVHELVAAAPFARDLDAACPWRDVLRTLGAAQTAAGCEITEAHETIAARIVAEVLA